MTSYQHEHLFRQSWHPSIDELLLYLDGEIQAKTNPKVETHLRICWSCRVRREEIDRLISAFMEHRKTRLTDSPNFPREALPRFAARLSHLQLDSGSSLRISHLVSLLRPEGLLRRFSLTYAIFLLACSLIVLCLLRLSSAPSVSALELLERTEYAEVERIRRVSRPVVHQKLQVCRNSPSPNRPEALTWEIWNDTSQDRFKQRVEDASGSRSIPVAQHPHPAPSNEDWALRPSSLPLILAELEQIFQANHLDRRAPLSPMAYGAWQKSLPKKTEQVIHTRLADGEKALALKVSAAGPFAVNSIIGAELVVRTKDWHPVQQHLKVQGEDGFRDYELTETTFEVLALNTLTPSIFAELTQLPPLLPIPRAPAMSSLASATPSGAELMAAEIEARYALHRLKACLGEPIQVTRHPGGRVEVHGLAEAPERKAELIRALKGIPFVTVKIQTVAEATIAASAAPQVQTDAENQPAATFSDEPPVVPVRNNRIAIQGQLERYFEHLDGGANSGQAQEDKATLHLGHEITNLMAEAVSLSHKALAEAWALRRLAEQYTPVNTERLRPVTWWLLEAMVQDHLTALRTVIHQSRTVLEPVLSSPRGENANSKSGTGTEAPETWVNEVLSLFATIDQMEQLTACLFAGANLPGGQEENATLNLLAAFNRVDNELQNLETLIAERSLDGQNRSELGVSQRPK